MSPSAIVSTIASTIASTIVSALELMLVSASESASSISVSVSTSIKTQYRLGDLLSRCLLCACISVSLRVGGMPLSFADLERRPRLTRSLALQQIYLLCALPVFFVLCPWRMVADERRSVKSMLLIARKLYVYGRRVDHLMRFCRLSPVSSRLF